MNSIMNRSRIATTVAALALLVAAIGGSVTSAYAKDDHDKWARIQQERRIQAIREHNERERRDNERRRFEWNKNHRNDDHNKWDNHRRDDHHDSNHHDDNHHDRHGH